MIGREIETTGRGRGTTETTGIETGGTTTQPGTGIEDHLTAIGGEINTTMTSPYPDFLFEVMQEKVASLGSTSS